MILSDLQVFPELDIKTTLKCLVGLSVILLESSESDTAIKQEDNGISCVSDSY